MAVGLWTRVLLPQLLGADLPGAAKAGAASPTPLSAAGATTCVAFLATLVGGSGEAALMASASAGLSVPALAEDDGSAVTHPVVPSEALEAVVRSCFSAQPPLATATRMQLLRLYETLREAALAGADGGGFDVAQWSRLAIDSAGASPGGYEGEGDELVAQAARNVVSCVLIGGGTSGEAAGEAWVSRHKNQLKGSTRVLVHLLATHRYSLFELRRNRPRTHAFFGTLRALRLRHRCPFGPHFYDGA